MLLKRYWVLKILKIEILLKFGPGRGALTDEILKKKPKSLTVIEKDYELTKI